MKRYTREQIERWLAESERVCSEAEMLVLIENGSRASRAALGIAQTLRSMVIARAVESAPTFAGRAALRGDS